MGSWCPCISSARWPRNKALKTFYLEIKVDFNALVKNTTGRLCDNLKGWDGVEVGGRFKVGGDVCILMADSHCCTAETNTTL